MSEFKPASNFFISFSRELTSLLIHLNFKVLGVTKMFSEWFEMDMVGILHGTNDFCNNLLSTMFKKIPFP